MSAIAAYSIRSFGRIRAAQYHAGLENTFDLLSRFSRIGLPTYDLREGLYRFPFKEHVVFYTHATDHIFIVRVLHGRSDFKRVFDP